MSRLSFKYPPRPCKKCRTLIHFPRATQEFCSSNCRVNHWRNSRKVSTTEIKKKMENLAKQFRAINQGDREARLKTMETTHMELVDFLLEIMVR